MKPKPIPGIVELERRGIYHLDSTRPGTSTKNENGGLEVDD